MPEKRRELFGGLEMGGSREAILNAWVRGLGVGSGVGKELVSETDEIRLWPGLPVNGVNEARLDGGELPKAAKVNEDVLAESIGTMLWRLLSVCSLISPRLWGSKSHSKYQKYIS